jgi:DNA-binding NarL/FixJ family response regulator
VALIDQDAAFRGRLRSAIDAEQDLDVMGEASACDEALALVLDGGVQVVISEAAPGRACLDLIEESRRRAPDTGFVVLAPSPGRDDALRLVRAGAAACLRRNDSFSGVLEAVRTVATGGSVLDPQALETILSDYRQSDLGASGPPQVLSPRESQVLTLIANGLSTREIADELGLSRNTVAVHRHHVMAKLGLHKAAHLVRYAVREGLVASD